MSKELDVQDNSYWWVTGPDGLEVVYCYAEENDDGRVWYEGRNISARVVDAKDERVSFHEECLVPVRLKRTPAELEAAP